MQHGDDDKGDPGASPRLHGNGHSRISLPNLRAFSSLSNPAFRLYYGALLGQRASTNMQMMARALLVYRLTGSMAILGGVALANALPMLLLSMFGGVIADRFHKKYVLVVGQLCSALISLSVALSLSTDLLSAERAGSWWILITASILQGSVMGLMVPSRQAIIPEIVGPEKLMNAIALGTLATNALRFLAPVITGFLIDAYDFQAAYFAMTGLYTMAVIFTVFMPLTGRIAASNRSMFADIIDGFQYVRRNATILVLLVFVLIVVLLSRPYMIMMPVFAEDILKVGASGMGVLMSVSGIGAIIGSVTLASLPNRKRGLMLIVGSLILGVALVAFSFSVSWYLSLGLVVLVGLGQAARMTLGNTLVQYYVEDAYRGRVMSIQAMDFGFTGLSTFAAGMLAEVVGVEWAVGGFAMGLVMLTLLALLFLPRIRKLN